MSNKIKSWCYAFARVYLPILISASVSVLILKAFSKHDIEILNSLINNEIISDILIAELNNLNIKVSYISSVIIFLSLLLYFRKLNINKIFNSNGNIYYDHSYITFWIASKIMGYREIQLSGIPLWMQSKIILNSTFPIIIEDMWENHYSVAKELPDIEVKEPKDEVLKDNKNLNIIIEDTYEIKINQIGEEFNLNPTLIISSGTTSTGKRFINDNLVSEVKKIMDKYTNHPYFFENIFIYSTANANNNLNITVSSLRKFGRFNNTNVYYAQMNNEKIYDKMHKLL